jgi:hypothetical protein
MAPSIDPPQPVTASGTQLSWRVESTVDGKLLVKLTGDINENADFTELRRQLHGDVELDLEAIARVNSCGVREWVNFVRALDANVSVLHFARCSPTVVLQLNTIFNFRGRARVESFLAPYVCEVCHVDEYRLLVVSEHFPDRAHPHVPAFRCGRCGGVMVFDELPERYLSFLVEEAGDA